MPSSRACFTSSSAGRHLGFGAAIDQSGRARAEAAGGADGVHGGVAAADYDYVAIAAVVDRLIVFRDLVGAHEIDAGEKFVGGVDAVEVFAGNAEKDGQTRAGGDKDRVVALVAHQLVERNALADDDVGFELDAHAAEVVDFFFHDRLGQAELGDAVDEDAA